MSGKPVARDPQTPAEWQEAVDAAAFWLLVDSAKHYGLVTGPTIDGARCEAILARGRAQGVRPAPDDDLIDRAFGPASARRGGPPHGPLLAPRG